MSTKNETKSDNRRFRIAVLLRGWVLIGVVEDEHEQALVFSSAAVIRRWGTTKGLGELVKGPTKETVTEALPSQTKVERRNLLFTVDVENAGWSGVLG